MRLGGKIMQLTNENYYSVEANKHYMSVSQLKNFIGTPFLKGCEKRALAEINGEYTREKSDALLIGSYVDAALTGSKEELQKFIADNPNMISSRGATAGQLKSQYLHANTMIDRVKRDKFFMRTLEGEHQVIMTGEIFGVPFKIKVDNLTDKAIVDLKTCESLTKIYYAEGRRMNFIEYHNYILQGAIYQEIVRQNTLSRTYYLVYSTRLENGENDVFYNSKPFVTLGKNSLSIKELEMKLEIDKKFLNKQLSYYEKLHKCHTTGIEKELVCEDKVLPFFLSCVSKEKVPDLGVYQIDNETLVETLASLEDDIKYVQMLKNGEVEPRECGCCDYCKEHKIIIKPINWLDLGDESSND